MKFPALAAALLAVPVASTAATFSISGGTIIDCFTPGCASIGRPNPVTGTLSVAVDHLIPGVRYYAGSDTVMGGTPAWGDERLPVGIFDFQFPRNVGGLKETFGWDQRDGSGQPLNVSLIVLEMAEDGAIDYFFTTMWQYISIESGRQLWWLTIGDEQLDWGMANGGTLVTGSDVSFTGNGTLPPAPVPLPATGFLLAGGLVGLAGLRRRK